MLVTMAGGGAGEGSKDCVPLALVEGGHGVGGEGGACYTTLLGSFSLCPVPEEDSPPVTGSLELWQGGEGVPVGGRRHPSMGQVPLFSLHGKMNNYTADAAVGENKDW